MQLDERTERIRQLVEPLARAEGLELVGVDFQGGKRGAARLAVYLDRPGGVTVEELAALSRQLGDLLDVHDLIEGRYVLEVSSPGLDRLLSRPEHFRQVVGGRVRVRTREPIDGRSNFVGVIEAAGEEEVMIKLPGETNARAIPYGMIKRANYQYDFGADPIGYGRRGKRGKNPEKPGEEG